MLQTLMIKTAQIIVEHISDDECFDTLKYFNVNTYTYLQNMYYWIVSIEVKNVGMHCNPAILSPAPPEYLLLWPFGIEMGR